MWEIDWINVDNRLPEDKDIEIQEGNDLFWVYLINIYGEKEVTTVNWNKYLKSWEVMPNEHVLFWAPWKAPNAPVLD